MTTVQLTLDKFLWITEIDDRAKWCLDRFGDQAHGKDEISPENRWFWNFQSDKIVWHFASEEDMMEFAMVWL